jgi:hypothetical protein
VTAPATRTATLCAGADKHNGQRRRDPQGRATLPWSQRWFDDPPIRTINYDGGRNPEIYIGGCSRLTQSRRRKYRETGSSVNPAASYTARAGA